MLPLFINSFIINMIHPNNPLIRYYPKTYQHSDACLHFAAVPSWQNILRQQSQLSELSCLSSSCRPFSTRHSVTQGSFPGRRPRRLFIRKSKLVMPCVLWFCFVLFVQLFILFLFYLFVYLFIHFSFCMSWKKW